MGSRLAEHLGGTLVVALLFGALIGAYQAHDAAMRRALRAGVDQYLSIPALDFGNPLDRALFRETLALFRPDSAHANEALLQVIDDYREAIFTNPDLKVGAEDLRLSGPLLGRLSGMYAGFIIVYAVVLLLTLYAAQTLGVYRFILIRQGKESTLREFRRLISGARHEGRLLAGTTLGRSVILLAKAALKGVATLVLFSPAYVTGYAVKTRLETDNIPSMIALALLSNGLLITYANKFTTLLLSESRKGYVETALAKGLGGSWHWNEPSGIRFGSLFRIRKSFSSHVLEHIFRNARYQYFPTLKEQASFLITGLIIIEMALNIQGHFGYELMQRLLYGQYDIVLAITFGIFLVVKATELVVDMRWSHEARLYANAS